ncbi:9087_t:CDS:2, partial [Acaulospora colombiana]
KYVAPEHAIHPTHSFNRGLPLQHRILDDKTLGARLERSVPVSSAGGLYGELNFSKLEKEVTYRVCDSLMQREVDKWVLSVNGKEPQRKSRGMNCLSVAGKPLLGTIERTSNQPFTGTNHMRPSSLVPEPSSVYREWCLFAPDSAGTALRARHDKHWETYAYMQRNETSNSSKLKLLAVRSQSVVPINVAPIIYYKPEVGPDRT